MAPATTSTWKRSTAAWRRRSPARAALAFYIAGADPYRGDRYGRLALSREGLAERDRRVLGRCAALGVPVAVVMGGGYAAEEQVVSIHLETVRAAAASLGGRAPGGAVAQPIV